MKHYENWNITLVRIKFKKLKQTKAFDFKTESGVKTISHSHFHIEQFIFSLTFGSGLSRDIFKNWTGHLLAFVRQGSYKNGGMVGDTEQRCPSGLELDMMWSAASNPEPSGCVDYLSLDLKDTSWINKAWQLEQLSIYCSLSRLHFWESTCQPEYSTMTSLFVRFSLGKV